MPTHSQDSRRPSQALSLSSSLPLSRSCARSALSLSRTRWYLMPTIRGPKFYFLPPRHAHAEDSRETERQRKTALCARQTCKQDPNCCNKRQRKTALCARQTKDGNTHTRKIPTFRVSFLPATHSHLLLSLSFYTHTHTRSHTHTHLGLSRRISDGSESSRTQRSDLMGSGADALPISCLRSALPLSNLGSGTGGGLGLAPECDRDEADVDQVERDLDLLLPKS